MKKNTLLLTLAVASLLVVTTASESVAMPISGEIFFSGSGTLMMNGSTAGVDAPNANEIAFNDPVYVGTLISTGDYAGLPLTTTATFTDLTGVKNFGAPGTTGVFAVNPFWSFVSGGLTYEFDLTALTTNTNAGTSIRSLGGAGIASITGFDATPGLWSLSTVGDTTSGVFSSNAAVPDFSSNGAVPDGGTTAALFGLALLGFGLLRRKLTS